MNVVRSKVNLMKLCKYFIKELKNNKLYRKFLQIYGQGGCNGSQLEVIVNSMSFAGIDDIDNDYDIIISHVNFLVRNYVEMGLNVHTHDAAKFGENLFNSYCISIFGEEKFHKDMNKLSNKKNYSDNDIINQYKIFKKHYTNLRFEDFVILHKGFEESLYNEMRTYLRNF